MDLAKRRDTVEDVARLVTACRGTALVESSVYNDIIASLKILKLGTCEQNNTTPVRIHWVVGRNVVQFPLSAHRYIF